MGWYVCEAFILSNFNITEKKIEIFFVLMSYIGKLNKENGNIFILPASAEVDPGMVPMCKDSLHACSAIPKSS